MRGTITPIQHWFNTLQLLLLVIIEIYVSDGCLSAVTLFGCISGGFWRHLPFWEVTPRSQNSNGSFNEFEVIYVNSNTFTDWVLYSFESLNNKLMTLQNGCSYSILETNLKNIRLDKNYVSFLKFKQCLLKPVIAIVFDVVCDQLFLLTFSN